jgi:hypothetical protein
MGGAGAGPILQFVVLPRRAADRRGSCADRRGRIVCGLLAAQVVGILPDPGTDRRTNSEYRRTRDGNGSRFSSRGDSRACTTFGAGYHTNPPIGRNGSPSRLARPSQAITDQHCRVCRSAFRAGNAAYHHAQATGFVPASRSKRVGQYAGDCGRGASSRGTGPRTAVATSGAGSIGRCGGRHGYRSERYPSPGRTTDHQDSLQAITRCERGASSCSRGGCHCASGTVPASCKALCSCGRHSGERID